MNDDICNECSKGFDRDEKVFRLEEWPAADAFEAEFCSRVCMIKYLICCSLCRYMKQIKSNEWKCNQKVCVLDKYIFKKKEE